MSGMNILTCDCTCPTEGVDCVCDVTEIYMSCGRHKLEIYETLPEKGVEGVTYFIGNNDDGYVEYVWSCGKFVEMGTATATLIAPMTTTKLGLGKLSTSDVLTESNGGAIGMNASQQLLARAARVNALGTVKLSTSAELTTSVGSEDKNVIGGFIGFNSDKQLVAQCASLDRYGTVRLGSQYHPTYEVPYVVGIGTSTNSGKRGQLAFNLRRTQSDGSPGCLKYKTVSTNPVQYEMFVEEGSDTQMGIVKMLPTLAGYTDEEIEERRETHAASVGLVLDGVEKFAEWFFTDERIYGYFDEWARTGALAETIWNTDEYRHVLLDTVCAYVEASDTVKELIESLTKAGADAWLNEKVTDQYIDDMFHDRVVEVTKQIADEHWTDDLDKAIAESTAEQVELQTEAKITEWFSKKENVEAVSDLVTEAVEERIYEIAESVALDYTKGVFNGKNKITVDGEERTFTEWASLEIQRLVNSQTTGFEARINELRSKLEKSASALANPYKANAVIKKKIWEGDSWWESNPQITLPEFEEYDYIEFYTKHWAHTDTSFIRSHIFPVWVVLAAKSDLYMYDGISDINGLDDGVTESLRQFLELVDRRTKTFTVRAGQKILEIYGIKIDTGL